MEMLNKSSREKCLTLREETETGYTFSRERLKHLFPDVEIPEQLQNNVAMLIYKVCELASIDAKGVRPGLQELQEVEIIRENEIQLVISFITKTLRFSFRIGLVQNQNNTNENVGEFPDKFGSNQAGDIADALREMEIFHSLSRGLSIEINRPDNQ